MRVTRKSRLLAALALLTPLLGSCGIGVEQTCKKRGLEPGSDAFRSCVQQERAAASQRIQQRRYRPGGGSGA